MSFCDSSSNKQGENACSVLDSTELHEYMKKFGADSIGIGFNFGSSWVKSEGLYVQFFFRPLTNEKINNVLSELPEFKGFPVTCIDFDEFFQGIEPQ